MTENQKLINEIDKLIEEISMEKPLSQKFFQLHHKMKRMSFTNKEEFRKAFLYYDDTNQRGKYYLIIFGNPPYFANKGEEFCKKYKEWLEEKGNEKFKKEYEKWKGLNGN